MPITTRPNGYTHNKLNLFKSIMEKLPPLDSVFDPNLTDKNTVHSYLPLYQNILQDLLDLKKSITLWEIGIQRGGSIIGWLKALEKFPGSQVVGIDCQKGVNILAPNYTEYILNAYDDDALIEFSLPPGKLPDIIIDDGSHAFNDLVFVCKNYPQFLKDDGILIIEDVPDINWVPKLAKMLPPGYYMSVADLRQKKGRWDDIMLIISKPQKPQPIQ